MVGLIVAKEATMKRRQFIKLGLLSAIPGLYSCAEEDQNADEDDKNFLAPRKTYCSPIPSGGLGNNYRPNAPMRNDIRHLRDGTFLHLNFKVVDLNKKCFPVAYAAVEVWQADPSGNYSDVHETTGLATNGANHFRGMQNTTPFGKVQFITEIPGWSLETISGVLTPRIPHINVKIHLENKTLLTTECYFPDDIIERIRSYDPYDQFKEKSILIDGQKKIYKSPKSMKDDSVWQQTSPDNTTLKIEMTKQGYKADLVIGVTV